MITDQQECDKAAKDLDLEENNSSVFQFDDRAHGCLIYGIVHSETYLVWAPTESHPHANVPCGTGSFNCICARYGNINFLLIKYKRIFKNSKFLNSLGYVIHTHSLRTL